MRRSIVRAVLFQHGDGFQAVVADFEIQGGLREVPFRGVDGGVGFAVLHVGLQDGDGVAHGLRRLVVMGEMVIFSEVTDSSIASLARSSS